MGFQIEISVKRKYRKRRSIRVRNSSQSIVVIFSRQQHFFKHLQHRAVANTLRIKRNAAPPRPATTKLELAVPPEGAKRAHRRRRARKECAPLSLTVDFEAIGWSRWIVYPKRYDAKLCSGRCKSPVTWRQRPTNHAILQSLMRLKVSRYVFIT